MQQKISQILLFCDFSCFIIVFIFQFEYSLETFLKFFEETKKFLVEMGSKSMSPAADKLLAGLPQLLDDLQKLSDDHDTGSISN